MWKYYIALFLLAGALLFYVFLEDPCNNIARADFSAKYPNYKILDSGSREGSPDKVHCHVYYQKPDNDQVYEDIWLYQNAGSGWSFSEILETRESKQAR